MKAKKLGKRSKGRKRIAKTLNGRAVVNEFLLLHSGSYDVPEYVTRGYYVDKEFTCRDCGKKETWTATQQKWWYEIAKGEVFTQATRCRHCRWKERRRKAEARRVHLEGLAAKGREIRG